MEFWRFFLHWHLEIVISEFLLRDPLCAWAHYTRDGDGVGDEETNNATKPETPQFVLHSARSLSFILECMSSPITSQTRKSHHHILLAHNEYICRYIKYGLWYDVWRMGKRVFYFILMHSLLQQTFLGNSFICESECECTIVLNVKVFSSLFIKETQLEKQLIGVSFVNDSTWFGRRKKQSEGNGNGTAKQRQHKSVKEKWSIS